MTGAQETTIWLARISAACYGVAAGLLLRNRERWARGSWTAGAAFMLLHILGAFAFFHDWSHTAAWKDTERQTALLFGVRWGGGVYLNYLFLLVWVVDCFWWWAWPVKYNSRPAWLRAGVHTFLAFMFVNATVVVWILRAVNQRSH